jgi:hypothetical protein
LGLRESRVCAAWQHLTVPTSSITTRSSWAIRRNTWRARSALAGLGAALGVAVIGTLAVRSAGGYESEAALRATNAAAASAAKHPCWLILADNLDAAALEWHEPWLARRIAYDARVELFSEPVLMRWATFQSGRLHGWLASTDGYQLLVGATQFRPALVHRLTQMPGGVVIADDDRGIAVVNTQAVRQDPPGCSGPAG